MANGCRAPPNPSRRRWVDDAGEPDQPEKQLIAARPHLRLAGGEPVQAVMEHIGTLSHGGALWFEQGIVAGDMVLILHEALSDTLPS